MMWLLLFALTLAVILLPMWPAIQEWHKPTDVVPLHIDTEDALDPPFLARAFAARLATCVAAGQSRMGSNEIALAPSNGPWPLAADELRRQRSRRVWRGPGDLIVPDGVLFLAEVAAAGSLCTAPGGSHRALLAGQRLLLAPHTTVLRWAHGRRVDVAGGCRLPGRVSADEVISLGGEALFRLLHAPAIRFEPLAAAATPAGAPPGLASGPLPSRVAWDEIARRGTCDTPLEMGDHRAWSGDLVGRADIVLGTGCLADGSLKSRADVVSGTGCTVTGSIVAEGRIELGARCRVFGAVVSETAIVLGAGTVVGSPDRPATVAAPMIDVAAGVVVHGTLWAGKRGRRIGEGMSNDIEDSATPGEWQHTPAHEVPQHEASA